MRVISGKYGGRRLAGFDEDHIRPMTDRVKESVFNILRDSVVDSVTLDLFCGTGSVGIEAMSRGAKSVDFVDASAKSLKVLQKNLDSLKVDETYQLHKKDAISFLMKAKVNQQFNLVLIDPPFPLKICQKVLDTISECEIVANGAIVVIEHSRHEPVAEVGRLQIIDKRDYGDKSVTFFKKEE